MHREEGMALFEETRVMTILRGIDRAVVTEAAEALYEGGIRVLEITLNTVGAFYIIKDLRKRFGKNLFIGAGTVLDVNDAKAALEAGASFLVSPHTDKRVIAHAMEENIPVFPGAMTPTEIVKAWRAGATAVKLFPTSGLGLPYVKELMGPLGHIPMMQTGGVDESNVGDYLRAGCKAVGVGSALLNPLELKERRYQDVSRRAESFMEKVRHSLKEL